ncbi:MAG: universal stress protein [Bacteroidia bacterium]|nr:universal stress protein [Bacteroidia bacterium]
MKAFVIKKILIPMDFSETALTAIEHAAFTAQIFKADLVLLHVAEKTWEKFSIVSPELRVEAPTDFVKAIEKRLEDIAAGIRSKYGVKSTCITTEGNIFSEIVNVSKEHEVDLVVMGTHGTSGVVEFFVGSNTYKVVTESICPVISVRAHANKVGFKDIVLPIDDSKHSRQKVNHAIVMAKQFASKIHILGLAEGDDATEMKKFELKLEQIEEYLKKNDVLYSRKVINGGNQAKATYEYAKEINADLIVIMTDQDETLTGRLLGTYAQQIINHSKIPVMSIQPVESEIAWVNPY